MIVYRKAIKTVTYFLNKLNCSYQLWGTVFQATNQLYIIIENFTSNESNHDMFSSIHLHLTIPIDPGKLIFHNFIKPGKIFSKLYC